jgi:hypothetical protein
MKLSEIQQALKVPKNNRNSFGNYNYRSAEDIIEAVKKIINPQGLALVITDDLVMVGQRIYVKATATIGEFSATGWAREEETKKGMDAAQVTGSASSYARKYALNGLLAIDDTKDADATNDHKEEAQAPAKPSESKPSASKKAVETACKRIKEGEKELYQKMRDQFTLEPTQVKDLLEAFAEPFKQQLNK